MKKKYPIASIFRRSIARILDIILIIAIFILFYFIFFGTKPLSISFKGYLFFLFTLFMLLILFFYFIFIPFIFKGRTLFIWALNMRIYNINITQYNIFGNNRNKFKELMIIIVGLLKRELFIWVILSIINFVLGIVIFILGDNNGLFFLESVIFSNFNIYSSSEFNPYAIIFTSLYSINFFILLLIFINFLINSNKRNIIDVFSETVTLLLKEKGKNDENKISSKKNINNYGLPLEILDSVFEELDELK